MLRQHPSHQVAGTGEEKRKTTRRDVTWFDVGRGPVADSPSYSNASQHTISQSVHGFQRTDRPSAPPSITAGCYSYTCILLHEFLLLVLLVARHIDRPALNNKYHSDSSCYYYLLVIDKCTSKTFNPSNTALLYLLTAKSNQYSSQIKPTFSSTLPNLSSPSSNPVPR